MKRVADKLLRLEKRIGKGIERLSRRKDVTREPFEIVHSILDEVEEQIETAVGSGRVFPYDRLLVHVAVPPGRGAAARAVFGHEPSLEERVRERLRQAGCEPPQNLQVVLKVIEGEASETWGGREFHVEYRTTAAGRRRASPDAGGSKPGATVPGVRLVVLEGRTARRTLAVQLERIEVGRTERVVDRARRRERRNQLVFTDDQDDAINATVSRAHAHLQWVPSERAFRLFDDGSAQGTRILRDGRTLEVPTGDSRGVTLRDGDELQFGKARVSFERGQVIESKHLD